MCVPLKYLSHPLPPFPIPPVHLSLPTPVPSSFPSYPRPMSTSSHPSHHTKYRVLRCSLVPQCSAYSIVLTPPPPSTSFVHPLTIIPPLPPLQSFAMASFHTQSHSHQNHQNHHIEALQKNTYPSCRTSCTPPQSRHRPPPTAHRPARRPCPECEKRRCVKRGQSTHKRETDMT